ncbi:zona pellucida sperm-binding protein 3-like [Hyla sarda]|uniref:zona pellucida sperm-binding protein 3-like n=1 Tax=Hyla sarda TaxID=327740 RepID=UPI0024C2542E|nr:zona pellucida sperm-binding protein 3-like [Hyla sarda]
MGQGGPGVVCLGLLVLGLGQDFAASKSLTRVKHQVDLLRVQNEEIGWSSSSRRYPDGAYLPAGEVDPGSRALGYNHLYGRGLVGYYSRGLQTSQLKPPISVQCQEGRMLVTVTTDLYGDGRLVKASDLTLGSQSCSAGPQSTDTMVVFDIGLQECGNSLQMTPDWLIYRINLTVNPISGNENVARVGQAVIPIQCAYPRYRNVSSNAVKPTWVPFASTVSSEERLVFSLRLMTEDWSAPRSSLAFTLQDVFYIEASLEVQNHIPMTLFIDSCVATTSPDPSSSPSYEIIAYHGCLTDGSHEDSSSAFRSPRPQQDKLQFTVDAFQFVDSKTSTIYITCSLRAAVDTQKPDPMNKACSYNKASDK